VSERRLDEDDLNWATANARIWLRPGNQEGRWVPWSRQRNDQRWPPIYEDEKPIRIDNMDAYHQHLEDLFALYGRKNVPVPDDLLKSLLISRRERGLKQTGEEK
jgi:hypothetical protein